MRNFFSAACFFQSFHVLPVKRSESYFEHSRMWQTKAHSSQLNHHLKGERKRVKRTYDFIHSYRSNTDEWIFEVRAHLRHENEKKVAIFRSNFFQLLINLRTFRGAWRCRLCNWQHNPLESGEGEKFKTWSR